MTVISFPFHSRFIRDFKQISWALYPEVKVDLVHKKINMGQDLLPWEHQRFSIGKMSAFTMSHFDTAFAPERNSVLDTKVDDQVVLRFVCLCFLFFQLY